MEINKQLFEDVLSGKLKGTFVLWCKQRISSTKLIRNNSYYSETHPYGLCGTTYTPNGLSSPYGLKNVDDIIDFIPETNMKENELTIEIPEGKIVDWDESKKQNKIVLKDKQLTLTYRDVCKKLFKGETYYTDAYGEICSDNITQCVTDPNDATTEHQLECILAKNKLTNVAKYLNGGWHPSYCDRIFLLRQTPIGVTTSEVGNGSCASDCGSIWFKSKELAQQAIEILGEETVKLALEPLGI